VGNAVESAVMAPTDHGRPTPSRFTTERLLLRARTMDDFEACLEMDRDPEVTAYVDGPWNDPDEHRAFLTQRILATYPPGHGYWTITTHDSPEDLLGWVLVLPTDEAGVAEIGWRLVRRAWGRGYATEAARRILDHVWADTAVTRVTADIHPDNRASIAVATKLGLRLEGARPDGALRHSMAAPLARRR